MNEAEIQVLASIRRAEIEGESADSASLEAQADRFRPFLEDWGGAYERLIQLGLVESDGSQYHLTTDGRPLAERYHAERPDHYYYYYLRLYPAAQASKAHSLLCETVYGADLVQDGQADMASVNDLIKCLEIKKGDRVLDLGCGAGGIAEYISDATGALVTGLEYAAAGVETALARTESKRDRLAFVHGDMNALNLPAHSFDSVFSMDTLYWAWNVEKTVSSIVDLIRPGGRFAIFIANTLSVGEDPAANEPRGTWVAEALDNLDQYYEVHDYTETFLAFWPKLKQVALELRDEFTAEGNEFIFLGYMKDADECYLPAADAGNLRRYLYVVKVPG